MQKNKCLLTLILLLHIDDLGFFFTSFGMVFGLDMTYVMKTSFMSEHYKDKCRL